MALCPACGNGAKPRNMVRHLRACCPDHLATPGAAPLVASADKMAAEEDEPPPPPPPPPRNGAADARADDGPNDVPEPLRALLEEVARLEAEQRRRILRITFMVEEREQQQRQQQEQQQEEQQYADREERRPPNDDDRQTTTMATTATATTTTTTQRRPLAEVARLMALPERRASRLLERAMRTIEMPRDPDPGLHVLHECARFLAVAKPPGVATTPAHRWRGGSMVNRLLWYGERAGTGDGQEQGSATPTASFEPRVLHRLDLDTSGVLLCAKDARAAAAGQAALAGRGGGSRGGSGGGGGACGGWAEKTYVALAYGWPPPWFQEDEEEGDGQPTNQPTPPLPPPPGVRAVELGAGDPRGALLAFEVDAAIGRHPGSAVGRRVAADGLPSWAAVAAAADEEAEQDKRRAGDKTRGDGEGDGEGNDFLPASTRFVVVSAAAHAAARPAEALETDSGQTDPAPLACDASRAATLATFGGGGKDPSLGRRRPSLLRACLVLAALRTGRTHQIRLHLAHAGLPVAGDELYGAPLRPALPRQALHAWRLAVECDVPPAEQLLPRRRATAGGGGGEGEEGAAAPMTTTTTTRLDVRAPLPDDMLRAAGSLGLPVPAAYR